MGYMSNKTFMDSVYRVWSILQQVDDIHYDCYYLYCLDGYIPNTPKFKLFKIDYVNKRIK